MAQKKLFSIGDVTFSMDDKNNVVANGHIEKACETTIPAIKKKWQMVVRVLFKDTPIVEIFAFVLKAVVIAAQNAWRPLKEATVIDELLGALETTEDGVAIYERPFADIGKSPLSGNAKLARKVAVAKMDDDEATEALVVLLMKKGLSEEDARAQVEAL